MPRLSTTPGTRPARWPARGGATGGPALAPVPAGAQERDVTYNLDLLAQSRTRWDTSAGLRMVYGDIYRAMAGFAAAGPALEVGSGAGTISDHLPNVVTSDICPTPYARHVASAYDLADVAGGPWSTIYAFDVLHHLREPFRFFSSAVSALRPSGRLVICDPAATAWGRVFFGLCHHEPMRAQALHEPYEFPPDNEQGEFANMAMAWSLFVRDQAATRQRLALAGLTVRHVHFRDVTAYPACGGFSGPRLLPTILLRALLAGDRLLPQAVLRQLALRMIVVLEKDK